MKKHWWLVLLTGFFLVGCGGSRPTATEAESSMENMDDMTSDAEAKTE